MDPADRDRRGRPPDSGDRLVLRRRHLLVLTTLRDAHNGPLIRVETSKTLWHAVMLGAYVGLSLSEITSLHVSNVTDLAIVVTGKGGHQRQLPLHPDPAAELLAYRQRHAYESGWYFPSAQRLDRPLGSAHPGKLIAQALPGHYTTHALRHRFATAAYLAQRDLRAFQELLGHTK